MIRSKPKNTTLFSLSLFLIIVYGIGFWAWFTMPSSSAIWNFVPILCFAIALLVSIKMLLGYRIVIINGDHWQVKRLVSKDIQFNGKDIEWWKEIEVKTAGGLYKQLHIHAGKGGNAKVSLQEHTNYQKILARLKAKYRQKEVKEMR